MKRVILGLAATVIPATSALAGPIAIRPPAYNEAIYGTPDNPLTWDAGPIFNVSEINYRSRLDNARIVAFEIANATPGGIVSWYGTWLGVVADDGTFATTDPIIPLTDGYDRQFAGRIRVKVPYNAYNEFDLVRFEVSGFQASVTPEPSIWAMMILGFGAVGSTVRRRRANIA